MTRRRRRWYAAEPLLAVLECRRRTMTMRALVERSGLDRRTLERLRHRSRLRSDSADRLAVALGCHPRELWSDFGD